MRDGGVTLLASYAYDPLSRPTAITYDNGAQTTHAYELDNDLSQVAQSYGVGAVNFDYLHNFVNQRTDTSVDDDAYLWYPDQAASNSYVANELNQYDDVDGTLYTYDLNGNLTGDGVNTYLYDVESRLISATTPSASADYSYDPFGRRGEKDVDGTVTRYVYDGDTVIAEYDGLDQLRARYIPGLGVDRPVVMIRGAAYSYYHYDGSGSVIAMTDVFGVVIESYAFGPYGESADPDAIGNPYRYTGRRLDAETGLYYYRARYYSVALGRFLQADPAGFVDGLNLYAYVGNDPLNFVDPLGLGAQNSGLTRHVDALSSYSTYSRGYTAMSDGPGLTSGDKLTGLPTRVLDAVEVLRSNLARIGNDQLWETYDKLTIRYVDVRKYSGSSNTPGSLLYNPGGSTMTIYKNIETMSDRHIQFTIGHEFAHALPENQAIPLSYHAVISGNRPDEQHANQVSSLILRKPIPREFNDYAHGR